MSRKRARIQKACCVPITMALAGLLILSLATRSVAQPTDSAPPADSDDPWAGVEELIVTGAGVLDSLTSATVSVTAFDSTDLDAIGASDVSDVAAYTPNLEIRTAGSTTATLFIRGVGLNDFTSNAAGSVAVYENDAPKNLPAIQLGQLYDLEGITVLKGPQGSGPGRNASAGAIKIYSKQPTDEFEAFLTIDNGNYDLLKAEGAINVPIIPEVWASRMAFSLERRDGLVNNRCGARNVADQPSGTTPECGADIRTGLDDDLNNIDVWAGRMIHRWETPVEDMTWTFTFHGSRRDQLATVGEHIGAVNLIGSPDRAGYRSLEVTEERAQIRAALPPTLTNPQCRRAFGRGTPEEAACRARRVAIEAQADRTLSQNLADRPLDQRPFEGAYNNPGYERQTTWGALLSGEWEVGGVRIKSITGFERYDRERLVDADYSPNVLFEFDIEDDAWQANTDLQVEGELEELQLLWSTGFFFLEERLDLRQETLGDTSGAVDETFQQYIQDTRSVGLFAEFEWDFLEEFTLEAGARYNWEQKRFDAEVFTGNDPTDIGASQCTGNLFGPSGCTKTVTVDHPTGELGISYAVDDLRTIYFKYSHGWKGAQFNARDGATRLSPVDVADPEVIDAFEIGFSGTWWDDRIALNGAFFWYLYQDYQVFTFTNNAGEAPQRVVINADDAELYGAELEGRIEPIDRLVAEVRFGWLESRFLDFSDAVTRLVSDGFGDATRAVRLVTDFNNNPLPNAPQFKVSGNISYELSLGRAGTLTPRYDFSWSDDVFFDPSGGTGSPDANGNTFMPDNTIGQEALLLQNFRITYATPDSSIEVAGWVRNLTNEVYKTLSFDASAGPGIVGNLVGDPRTYGVSTTVRY